METKGLPGEPAQLYPLNVVVVCQVSEVAAQLRGQLTNLGAYVESTFKDHAAAIAATPASSEVRLFVVHVNDAVDVAHLKRLTGTMAGQPVLAVVNEDATRQMLFDVMRAGAMQQISLPLDVGDFKATLDWFAMQFGYVATKTQVVAVAGVTGGCGSTSLAVNLAYELARQHDQHTILTEMSLAMGAISTYLDVKPRHTTRDLFNRRDAMDMYLVQDALTRVMDNLDVLPGYAEAITNLEVSVDQVNRFVSCVRRLADVVVIDVGSKFDDVYFETLASSNQVLLVCQQSLPSIRNVKMVREAMSRQDGVRSPIVVVNRFDPKRQPFTRAELMDCLQTKSLRTVADDPAVNAAVNSGHALRLEAPRCQALQDVDRLARELLDEGEEEDSPSTLFTRAMRACGLR